MNTKIINGQTYTESEDVEGEYILLQENKENISSNSIADFIMITVGKINNMTKKDIIKITKSSSEYSCRYIKAEYFAKLLCEKYDLDFKIKVHNIIHNYGTYKDKVLNMTCFRNDLKYPFTFRKTKKIEYEENDMHFTKYLIETHWDAFKSKKYNFIQNHC